MTNGTYPVLHIDDDASVTRFVASLLRQHGIECASLNDPASALTHVANENYRVVLLDIDMPGINGLELLRQIKRRDGGVNVIMVTGLVSQATVLQSLRCGALACVFKPVTDAAPLIDAIHLAYDNIERWWRTLKQLSELKNSELTTATAGISGARPS